MRSHSGREGCATTVSEQPSNADAADATKLALYLPVASRALGGVVALVGAWYLAGWLRGTAGEHGLVVVTIKANAALCLLLLGAALAAGPPRSGRFTSLKRFLVPLLGGMAALIGGLTLSENLFGWDLGIDQVIAREVSGAIGVTSPNRMGVPGSVSALLIGLAILLLSRPRPRVVLAQSLSMVVVVAGLLASVGYFYDVPAFYAVARLTGIALPTALAAIALALGVLFAHPGRGLVSPLTADDPGGHLLRRLLLPALLIPVLLGWLRLAGERRAWYDTSVGTGLLVLVFMLAVTALLAAVARLVNRWAAALRETQAEREELHRTIAEDRERLRASNERLRSMFDSAAAGIAQVDLRTGAFLRVNDQFSALTGYSEGSLLSMTLYDVTHPADHGDLDGGLERGRKGGRGRGYFAERRYVCADGREIDVELHGSVVSGADGRPVEATIIVLDVTDRKLAERELAAAKQVADRARAVAEEANRAKDHFLSVLSHELRTPLSPVLTGISLLQQEVTSPHAKRILDVLLRNIQLESRLIDDLLDLTRITRGKVELDRRRQDLRTIVERAVEVCNSELEARSLHFKIDYGTPPYIVDGDGARLQQVFWNLLKNAIKFTPAGGCIGVRLHSDIDDAVVEIADSGIGIEESALGTIFDAFAQAERSITRQYGGLGLGLAISRALVELHGGSIEAASDGKGSGATFSVRLPLAVREVHGLAEESASPLEGTRGSLSLRILLVEDHRDTAELMTAVLQMAGHSVACAGSVASALAMAATEPFDLIVSDLGLPDRSGLDLVRELRSLGSHVPAIALSGYGRESDIQESREAGFDAHLVKPAEPRLLLETMERLVSH